MRDRANANPQPDRWDRHLLVLVVAGTVLQAMRWAQSKGAGRKAESMLLMCYGALVVAGIIYFFTTKTGMGWIGLDDLSPKGAK